MNYIGAAMILVGGLGAFAIMLGWLYMWCQISEGRLWGLIPAMLPFVIGVFFLLAWRMA